jgi:hypothetical protein
VSAGSLGERRKNKDLSKSSLLEFFIKSGYMVFKFFVLN